MCMHFNACYRDSWKYSMFQRLFFPEHTVISMQDLSVLNVCSKIEQHNGTVSIINGQRIKIDYFIESVPYRFLFMSRKTLETNE